MGFSKNMEPMFFLRFIIFIHFPDEIAMLVYFCGIPHVQTHKNSRGTACTSPKAATDNLEPSILVAQAATWRAGCWA